MQEKDSIVTYSDLKFYTVVFKFRLRPSPMEALQTTARAYNNNQLNFHFAYFVLHTTIYTT